ncbi:MAG: iron uptake porin [Leptolyngbyaceae cyanobacterium CSU_1_3]|nr:iron uptake porin [Leptolyngbyaceae cyanobacterium CSU_1_3]
MFRLFWSVLAVAPVSLCFGAIAAFAAVPEVPAQTVQAKTTQLADATLPQPAMPSVNEMSAQAGSTDVSMSQVTSVSQLSDVRPTDWAFQALQSLVERYGCIAGYPDRTYRGNRAMTRFEFAAGLNACLDRVNELIAAATADLVKKEDLSTLQKLQEEFAAELATLRGQVDALEARTTTLEKQQFSTTTKLAGEAIFSVSGVLGDDRAINSDLQRIIDAQTTEAGRETAITNAIGAGNARRVQENTIFADRVRLALDTSFTGKDRLRTRLQARNITSFSGAVTGTNMTRLGYDGSNNNSVELSRLEYRFPLGDLTTVFIGTGTNDGLEFNDSMPILSPTESSGSGAISRFGRFNPIYRLGAGTGIIVNHKFGSEFSTGSKFTLSLGYLAPTGDAQDPGLDRGLFNGSHTALAQLVFQPTPSLGIGLTYANAYYNSGVGTSGGTGSAFANNPFASTNAPNAAGNVPTSVNAYGVQASLRLSPKFILSGWAGLTDAESKRQVNTINGQGSAADPAVRRGDSATIWNWAVTLAFPDLMKEGNLGGIVFGMPPKVTDNDYGTNVRNATSRRREDTDTSYHLEAFYRYRLNDNIAITPGFLVIFNPEHNSANDTIYVGTVRTTFTF